MPYVSKAQAERARWMTPAEAVTHIQTCDGCDADGAAAQLRAALGDEQICTWWGDRPLPSAQRTGPRLQVDGGPSDRPGQGPRYWQAARIRGAEVFDPNDSELTSAGRARVAAGELGRWRPLLLLRRPVETLWPAPVAIPNIAPKEVAPPNVSAAAAGVSKCGRPSRHDEIIAELSAQSPQDRARPTKVVAEEIRKALVKRSPEKGKK